LKYYDIDNNVCESMKKLVVKKNDADQRLDRFIRKVYKLTNLSLLFKIIRKGKIKLNGEVFTNIKYRVKENDVIEIDDSDTKLYKQHPPKIKYFKKIDINIIYENNDVLIIEKPNTISTHGFEDSADKQVLFYLKSKGDITGSETSFLPVHVHRIDKKTSGILIFAKTFKAAKIFNMNHSIIKKEYIAVCKGLFKKDLIQEGNIAKKGNLQQIGNSEFSKKFAQEISPIKEIGKNTLIKVVLRSGRKHQIRAGLNYLGHPLIGDTKYRGPENNILLLHAYQIQIPKFICEELKIKKNKFYSFPPDNWEDFLGKDVLFIKRFINEQNKR